MARRTARNAVETGTVAWTWSAVAAGVIASLVVMLLLTMLGLGAGFLTIDAPAISESALGVSWAAFLWWAASGIIAAYAGGWVAGIYAPANTRTRYVRSRGAHALAAWGVAVIIIAAASAVAAGSTSLVGALGGPTTLGAQIVGQADVTTGQAVSPVIDQARQHLAAGMLASFFALLLGAAAAWYGGESAAHAKKL